MVSYLKISKLILGLTGVLVQGQGRVPKTKRIIKNLEGSQIKMCFDHLTRLLCSTQATLVYVLMVTQTQLHIRGTSPLRKAPE